MLSRFSRRYLVAASLVVVVVIVGGALTLLAMRSTRADSPFGAYAGFVWHGRVVSVEGSWTVPRIGPESRSGLAGTWIAAQAPGVGPPFVQVGDDELRGDSPSGIPESRYRAFWTDTSHQFHPVFLFRVKAGDDLAGRLVLERGHWIITLTDRTSGAQATTTAAAKSGAVFDRAEWMQEDERTVTGQLAPYPSLAPVHFGRIAVNSATPSTTSLDYSCMSIGGSAWVPSRLRNGAFTIRETPIARLTSGPTTLRCRR